MSVHVSLKTPRKKALAEVLRAIARLIEESSNPTVTLELSLRFDPRKKEAEKE